MPIYRYKCKNCGTASEILVPNFDATPVCPQCGAAALEKLPSLIGGVLNSGPASCSARHDCPSAGGVGCGCGCGCGGHHHHRW
ncbi:MAG: zinc ribbon domain-containing protein [Victivallaceae bacterium]|nr:zinc ribbon domain-containing protein [Victivallaceae bacterium]